MSLVLMSSMTSPGMVRYILVPMRVFTATFVVFLSFSVVCGVCVTPFSTTIPPIYSPGDVPDGMFISKGISAVSCGPMVRVFFFMVVQLPIFFCVASGKDRMKLPVSLESASTG